MELRISSSGSREGCGTKRAGHAIYQQGKRNHNTSASRMSWTAPWTPRVPWGVSDVLDGTRSCTHHDQSTGLHSVSNSPDRTNE